MKLRAIIRCAIPGLIFLAGIVLTGCKPIPPSAKPKAVFVFCDLTGSLAKTEREQAASLTVKLLDKLPDDAAYTILPINPFTEKTETIVRHIPGPAQAKFSKSLRSQFKQVVLKEAKEIDEMINVKGKGQERTCILNGLRRVKEFFNTFKAGTHDLELVFISDMFEECEHVPENTGVSVTIKDQNLQNQLNLIETLELPDLSGVKVSIVVPATNETMEGNKNAPLLLKPNFQTLNVFWARVFKRCKIEKDLTLNDWTTATVPNFN